MSGVAPIQHKFRNFVAGKRFVDFGQPQHFKYFLAGLPVFADGFWQAIVLYRGLIACPLATNVFDKPGVPCAILRAALAPVKHKLRHGIFDKSLTDISVTQDVGGLATRLPLRRHWDFQLAGAAACLLLTPLSQNVFVKRIAPGKS